MALSPQEQQQFRAAIPQIEFLASILAEPGLPVTLDHGDLWTGNILLSQSGLTFIDWSDAAISHPFFSLASFLSYREMEPWPPDRPAVRHRLRDAYLEPWGSFATAGELRRAFDADVALGSLGVALFDHRTLLPALESTWETDEIVPWALRKFLQESTAHESR